MNTATFLTLIRFVIAPLFLFMDASHETLGISPFILPYLLLALWGIAELSDICDGYIARKYHQVTELGKVLDPMADSVYRMSLFLAFTLPPIRLPLLLVFILFYRDALISTLRLLCALKGVALAARPSGKIKAIFQGTSACIMLLLWLVHVHGYLSAESLVWTSTSLMAAVTFYTLLSGCEYLYAHRHFFKRLGHPQNAID